MYEIKGFTPREYQENICKSCEKNTLVCLPTGTGKTKIAIMVLIKQLNKFHDSKIVIISPTKPLSAQIAEEIKECTTIPASVIMLLTGTIDPDERKKLFNAAKVVVATPQTIQSDIKNKRISLEDVSLLVVDECHRSKERFANTIVAKHYVDQTKQENILALTASPGATKEKVGEVCKNLFIDHIEIRTEQDPDLAKYIQKKELEIIKVELPKQFEKIRKKLQEYYKSRIKRLGSYGMYKPSYLINKTDLLALQRRLQGEISHGDRTVYAGLSLVAELLKLNYAMELIETQTVAALEAYFKKLEGESSKAAKKILKDASIKETRELTKELVEKSILHPKMQKVKEIVKKNLGQDPEWKSIIFANYRATVAELKNVIETIENAKPVMLVGQKDGVTQKKQLQTIERFNNHKYNILICTSIGEEGLSIGSLNEAIFYDHTASEIRKIQRSGRVARIKAGKIVNLITVGTRDEALHWSAKRKEKKMHSLLYYMKRDLKK